MIISNVVKGKKSWPELVGAPGQTATSIIESENRKVDAIIVEEGDFVSTDVRCDRVRVFVDANHVVKKVPKIG